LQALPTSSST